MPRSGRRGRARLFRTQGARFGAWLLLACILAPHLALADHLPKWEVGAGVSVLRLPAYRGAERVNNYLLPVPYVVYRGEFLNVDDKGIRGRIFDWADVRLDFSLAGNLPVDDDEVRAREDMPGLDPLGEIGPSLDVRLASQQVRDGGRMEYWLRLPLRLAFSVGDPVLADRGWVFSPNLNVVYRKPISGHRQISLNLTVGPLFASERYHDYFYEVAPQYVTATREQFDAESGYSGSRLSLGLGLRSREWLLGAYIRYDTLQGASFTRSPLVETENYFTLAVLVSRILRSSSEMVAHE